MGGSFHLPDHTGISVQEASSAFSSPSVVLVLLQVQAVGSPARLSTTSLLGLGLMEAMLFRTWLLLVIGQAGGREVKVNSKCVTPPHTPCPLTLVFRRWCEDTSSVSSQFTVWGEVTCPV